MNIDLRDGRRQRLVHSAKMVFATKGYNDSSISQIVRHAGIARSTFYQYFDGKLHLFQHLLDSFLEDLRGSVTPISLAPGAPAPLIQVQENLTRVLKLVLGERDLTRIILQHTSSLDPTVEKQLQDFYGEVAGMIDRSLKLGVAMNMVRPCNTRLTAYSMVGAVKEVVFQLTSTEGPQPPVEELVQELIEFGMGGILVESHASQFSKDQRANNPEHAARVNREGR